MAFIVAATESATNLRAKVILKFGHYNLPKSSGKEWRNCISDLRGLFYQYPKNPKSIIKRLEAQCFTNSYNPILLIMGKSP